jgi:hypothetical protein
MAKLVYPIELAWKGSWGAWEAFRELIQNALDAADDGGEIKVWRANNGTIHIVTTPDVMTRGDLVLGATSKHGSNARGRKGEGMKIAMMTLVRLGCAVKVRTGAEIWTPRVEAQEAWGGKECLVIETKSAPNFAGVKIEIDGFSREAFDQSLALILDSRIPGTRIPAKTINTSDGTLLDDPVLAGKLFVGGLYVCDLAQAFSAPFVYGFDFRPDRLELDSDRKLADPWTTRYRIGKMIEAAFQTLSPSIAYDLLRVESFETKQIAQYADSNSALVTALTAEHDRRHGSGALAASTESEARQGSHVGLTIPVIGELAKLIQHARPLDRAIESAARGAKRVFDRSELTGDERTRLDRVEELASFLGTEPIQMTVVEFWRPSTQGECQGQEIRIARSALESDIDAIRVLIHEYAHRVTGAQDGTQEHIQAIEFTGAKIVAGLMSQRATLRR